MLSGGKVGLCSPLDKKGDIRLPLGKDDELRLVLVMKGWGRSSEISEKPRGEADKKDDSENIDQKATASEEKNTEATIKMVTEETMKTETAKNERSDGGGK